MYVVAPAVDGDVDNVPVTTFSRCVSELDGRLEVTVARDDPYVRATAQAPDGWYLRLMRQPARLAIQAPTLEDEHRAVLWWRQVVPDEVELRVMDPDGFGLVLTGETTMRDLDDLG